MTALFEHTRTLKGISHFPGTSSTKRSKNSGSSKSATSYRPFRFRIFRVGHYRGWDKRGEPLHPQGFDAIENWRLRIGEVEYAPDMRLFHLSAILPCVVLLFMVLGRFLLRDDDGGVFSF
uniref:Uncharacterized protein n=1 Tax=Candidatus Kentrum sp. MB TaxID=2138164 RepID=A0A450X145_9GAMM|nr:MAG: hypothetical protein BECKMB1821G_GA0114241_100378 [Candidatus Kentron sp. MB]